jgi:3-oxoacyl-[acyl-carrier protein] reductase
MSETFSGRIVLVAGCRGLIGGSLCEFFLARGAQVVGFSRTRPALEHENFHYFACDVSDEQAVVNAFHNLDASERAPDTLILSAAAFSTGMVALLTGREVESVLATNIKGSLFLAREAVKRMIQKRFGRVIALSSICVSRAERGTALYALTKAGLEQLIKVLPMEVGDCPITFNAIEISLLEDGMASSLSPEAHQRLLNSLAIKQFCTIDNLYNTIEFFAKLESSYITGQILKLGFI